MEPDTTIRLSVILPCYRVEAYLRRCLDSLLDQTLEGVELICVNDGSPDGCLSILREYESRYGDRVTVIDQQNAGVWAARRRGVEAARGEYIGFIDPDDYVCEDYAEKLYQAAKARNADIACCGFDRIDAETGKRYSREMTKFPYDAFNLTEEPGLLLEVNAALWNKIYRAELLKDLPEPGQIPKVLEDMLFSQLVFLNAGDIAFVRDSLVCYMVRRDSAINTVRPGQIPVIYDAMKELRHIVAGSRPERLPCLDALAFLHLGVSLMHRVSAGGSAVLKRALRENTAFLDREFPGWRNNPYIRLGYVMRHRGANGKLWLVRRIYGLSLAVPFLLIYGAMIDRLGVCVKW
ncbi:MAG: glycosyltransferase [Oscillospiraceae bacterium]|nr:glycosyltransferase [Oscillospiraceae bacterium]